jgi:hypothetical protein
MGKKKKISVNNYYYYYTTNGARILKKLSQTYASVTGSLLGE